MTDRDEGYGYDGQTVDVKLGPCPRCGGARSSGGGFGGHCSCIGGVMGRDDGGRWRPVVDVRPPLSTCGLCRGPLAADSLFEQRVNGVLTRVCTTCHVARGPRPVSAEDAMKRANEACALAEKAEKAIGVGNLSTHHRALVEGLREAHNAMAGRLQKLEDRAQWLVDRLEKWPHPGELEDRLTDLQAQAQSAENRAQACARIVDTLGSKGVLEGIVASRVDRLTQAVDVQMKERATADVRLKALECWMRDIGEGMGAESTRSAERAQKIGNRIEAIEKALGELGHRAGTALARLEERTASADGFEDEARGARTMASTWRRSTWVALTAAALFAGAFACAGWRCVVLAREADDAKARLLETAPAWGVHPR